MCESFKFFLILLGIGLTTSDHSVQFLSTLNNGQLVTSSTLKWISAENGKVPVNAVIGATRHSTGNDKIEDENVYICRARHDAEWIPGQLVPTENACYISLLGLVKSYKVYEVLQNVENGSRLTWTDWDTYHQYPSGIVAGGVDLYIARKKVGESEDNDVSSQVDESLKSEQGYSHYVGKFNSKDAFGKISVLTEKEDFYDYDFKRSFLYATKKEESIFLKYFHWLGEKPQIINWAKESVLRSFGRDGVYLLRVVLLLEPECQYKFKTTDKDKKEKGFIKGQLLIETEPIRYELNNAKYTVFRRRVVKQRKALASTVLRNTEDVPLKVDSILAYDSVYSSYWGQGNAILKGLTTIIRNATTGNIIAEIKWGTEETEERKDVFKVEMTLQPGTAVNVTIWGNETKSELPYTGTLVSFYKGGATTSRKIDGSRKLLQMLDVKPEMGPIYFIRNNSLVPTTTTTTTTTTTSTTTSTTSTTTTTTEGSSNLMEYATMKKKNNSLFPLQRDSQSNDMLSDDGALSLKKNEDVPQPMEIQKEGVQGSSSSLSPSLIIFILSFSTLFPLFTAQRIT